MKKAPTVSKQLLDYVDEMFPERCPDPKDSEREVWMKTGARGVFRHLKAVFEFQHKKDNILTKG